MAKKKSGQDYRPKRFLSTDNFGAWIFLAACIIREAEREKTKIITPRFAFSATSYTNPERIKEAEEFLNSDTCRFYKEVINDYTKKKNRVSCDIRERLTESI